jgi:recombinational DNA repair protein RecR
MQLTQTSAQGNFANEAQKMNLPRITIIARGVAQNDELQHTDEATLSRALVGRTLFTI